MPSPEEFRGGHDDTDHAVYEAYKATEKDEDVTLLITFGSIAAAALAGCIVRKLRGKGR